MHQEHKTIVHKIIVLRKKIEVSWPIECFHGDVLPGRILEEHKFFILVTCQAQYGVITLGPMVM